MNKKLNKKLSLNKDAVKNLNIDSGVKAGGTQPPLCLVNTALCGITNPCITDTCPSGCIVCPSVNSSCRGW